VNNIYFKSETEENGLVITRKRYGKGDPIFKFEGDEVALCQVIESSAKELKSAKVKLSCAQCLLDGKDKKNGGLMIIGKKEQIQQLCVQAYKNKSNLPKSEQHNDIGHEFFCISLQDMFHLLDDESFDMIGILEDQKFGIERKKVVLQHHTKLVKHSHI
jgi:hypothetical protein